MSNAPTESDPPKPYSRLFFQQYGVHTLMHVPKAVPRSFAQRRGDVKKAHTGRLREYCLWHHVHPAWNRRREVVDKIIFQDDRWDANDDLVHLSNSVILWIPENEIEE